MNLPFRRALFALALLLSAASVPGDADAQQPKAAYVPEFGTMWTFDAPPTEYWQQKYGWAPDQKWLDHVRKASIRLPGCSSSFVSANGLVMTNHHCARECISATSPADTNYQRTGFVAPTLGHEKKCPGLYVDQLESIEDVTARIRAKVTGTTPAERVAQRDAEIGAVQRECAATTKLNCQVIGFYQGGMYSVYRFKRYDDVRLVMAPEEEISFFGGDPDNFTYPRYALDVTLLRVYENDRPHRPTDYLKWSRAGATEDELVFVIGNPGSTGRMLTLAQMEYLRDVAYPAALAQYRRQIDAMKKASEGDEELKRRYENAIFSLENALKATTGYLSGLQDSAIMARKQAFERDFRARITADPKLRAQYGGAWDEIARAQQELATFNPQLRYYSNVGGSPLLTYAMALVRLHEQTALPEAQRMPAYRGPALNNLRNALTSAAYDRALDRHQLAAWLAAAKRELPADDPLIRELIGTSTPEAAAERLISSTRLGDVDFRKALVEGGAEAVAASTDPLIAIARRLDAPARALAERNARLQTAISSNAGKVGEAIFAAYGKALPPDATFSLRISDGLVKGYPNNGTIAPYKTTMYGLFGRAAAFNDEPPFHIPPRWRAAEDRLDLSTPMNFVSTNDIIGGNSGSPVVNRDAEVVGLVFDGNIEMLPNRFIFTDEVSRTVSVHSRAIVEALRKVYDAGRIADELEGK